MSDAFAAERVIRSRNFKRGLLFVLVAVVIYLLWALKELVLPILLGLFLAYIFLPAKGLLKRRNVPHVLSVLTLVVVLFVFLFYAIIFIKQQVPDRDAQLKMRVLATHQLNSRYQSLFPPNTLQEEQSLLYQVVGFETASMMDALNGFLSIRPADTLRLREAFPVGDRIDDPNRDVWDRIYAVFSLPLYASEGLLADHLEERESRGIQFSVGESNLSILMNFFSTWLLMPVMFFFFLLDDGQLRRNLLLLAPNTYFEMVYTSIRRVDRALGNYLRGTLLETLAVFLCTLVLLSLIGFGWKALLLLSTIGGILNIIPVIGPLAGGVVYLAYALLVDQVSSVLPFVNEDTFLIATLGVAVAVQLLDNAILKPYILGNAIDLHPLLVFMGVMSGALLFGFWGALFSIPFIVIVKVSVHTLIQQMVRYRLIDL